ncbi:hypothetical protein LJR153_005068 [Paenibacillus sp. LjRoot153]|uniref:hypothetical protein n=1 Tax=Paenibacillus sp. LjRoot153 TaxID=3342270 RepID=UPI003ECC632E
MAQDWDNEDRLYREQRMKELSLAAGGIVSSDNLTRIGEGQGSRESIVPLDSDFAKTIRPLADAIANIRINTYNKKTIKGRIFDYFNKQTEKGVKKYGHTLDDCPDDKFDWRLMIIEELIDCVQYQQKEIVRLESEKNNLITDKALLERLLNP